MDAEEINGLLWDTLAQASQPLSAPALSLKSGQPLLAVQSGLARLRQANLVNASPGDAPGALMLYRVILDLDAMRWAQAVGMGVGLLSLERHARLSSAARAQGLKLATDGTLDRLDEKKRTAKRRARDAAMHGRAASRAAASDLAQILKDTQAALARVSRPGTDGHDRAIALLLQQANDQAEKALNGLVKSLVAK